MQMRRFWEDVYPYHLITTIKGGARILSDPQRAKFIQDYLLEARRRDDIMLLAYCIMPEHVHICMAPRKKDPSIFMMNLKLMCVSRFKLGSIWEKRFFDKRINSLKKLNNTVEYIHNNPVEAGYVEKPEQWKYSSAGHWEELDYNIVIEYGTDV